MVEENWPGKKAGYRRKRNYRTLPSAPGRISQYGWSGLSRYVALVLWLAVPQSLMLWLRSATMEPEVFTLLSISYGILFVLFCVIARPWERKGL